MKIPVVREIGMGVAALAPSEAGIMLERGDPRTGYIGVQIEVNTRSEQGVGIKLVKAAVLEILFTGYQAQLGVLPQDVDRVACGADQLRATFGRHDTQR